MGQLLWHISQCNLFVATVKKAKIAAQVRKNQQQYIQKIQEDMERKQLEYEKKMESVVDFNYTEEIRKGVIEKMTLAAKKYDRNHPSAVSLDGFQGNTNYDDSFLRSKVLL